ncbi:lipoprotein [soil metagenome]
MKIVKTAFSLATAILLMGGCAFTPVLPGMSRDQVLASHGKPTRVVALDSGTRLQYSRQPAGQSVVMVDLDAADKVAAVREVMTLREFSRIEPGKWTREDVEREFGPPAWVDGVASWPGDIMTYRWRENNIQDMFFWVYLDADNRVQRTGQGMEIPTRMHLDD